MVFEKYANNELKLCTQLCMQVLACHNNAIMFIDRTICVIIRLFITEKIFNTYRLLRQRVITEEMH